MENLAAVGIKFASQSTYKRFSTQTFENCDVVQKQPCINVLSFKKRTINFGHVMSMGSMLPKTTYWVRMCLDNCRTLHSM
jgi:hypothetical protein